MPGQIDEILMEGPEQEEAMASNRRLGERRDISNWEKRLFLWGMSILVLTATSQIFDMNSNFRAAQNMIQVNTAENTSQGDDITALEKGWRALELGHADQEYRLSSVEEIIDIKTVRKKRGVGITQ